MMKISKDEIKSAIGVFWGIGLVAAVAESVDDNLLLAPFGATSVIAFLTPESKFAQPYNIVLGYTITSLVGLLVAYNLGHNWFTYALAVSLAMIVKVLFNAVHPPSAAMPIILINAKSSNILAYVFQDVIPGLLLLVAAAVIYNHFILRRDYPLWRRKRN